MKLHDDVMNDLLTVYLAGEASAETKALIEARAAEHRAFAERLSAARSATLPTGEGSPLREDAELRALKHTRQFLFLRTMFLAWAILFTLLPLLFTFDPDGVQLVIWGRHPGLVVSFWSVGTVAWVAASVMHRRVRRSGL